MNEYAFIQREIEAAMEKSEQLYPCSKWKNRCPCACLGQVFHLIPLRIWHRRTGRTLNSLLPHDIRIQDVCLVEDDFHARFHAVSKRYDYLITTDVNNPFYYP